MFRHQQRSGNSLDEVIWPSQVIDWVRQASELASRDIPQITPIEVEKVASISAMGPAGGRHYGAHHSSISRREARLASVSLYPTLDVKQTPSSPPHPKNLIRKMRANKRISTGLSPSSVPKLAEKLPTWGVSPLLPLAYTVNTY